MSVRSLMLTAVLCALIAGCAHRPAISPAPHPQLTGTPAWFSIGGEVYYEDDRDRVLDRPLPLVPESRWFCDYSRPLQRMPTEETPDPSPSNFLVLSENQLLPPKSVDDLRTVDQGCRLTLNLERDVDSTLLQLTLTLTARTRPIERTVEHRCTNALRFLFAIYADGEALTMHPGGFARGGAAHVVDLVAANSDRTWTIRAKGADFDAILHDRHPSEIAIVAAFCERQHKFTDLDARPYPHDERIESGPSAEGVILVRSNVATIQWNGPSTQRDETKPVPHPPDAVR
jgi:hypothetical protein